MLGFFVQVNAIGCQRLLALFDHLFGLGIGISTRGWTALAGRLTLGNAVRDVIHRVKSGHFLRLKKIDSVTFALGEQGHQNICARDFLSARGLNMNRRTLHNTLETRGWLGFVGRGANQALQVVINELLGASAQLINAHVAGFHHRNRIRVIAQREQQMLKRRVLVVTF